MKQLALSFVLLSAIAARAQEQIIKENFETHNLENVTFLPSQIRFGNFIYEFRYNGSPVDSSSLATYFDNDGSIFVGQQKKVTDFRIRSFNGDEFSLNSFQFSSNHPYPNDNEVILVRGWRDGKVVTAPVSLEVVRFEPPGLEHDFTTYLGFDKVDEIKITGEDLQFTVESFSYSSGTLPVAKEKGQELKINEFEKH